MASGKNGSLGKLLGVVVAMLTIFGIVGGIFMAVGSEKESVSTNTADIAENKADIKAVDAQVQDVKADQKSTAVLLARITQQMDKADEKAERQSIAIHKKIDDRMDALSAKIDRIKK